MSTMQKKPSAEPTMTHSESGAAIASLRGSLVQALPVARQGMMESAGNDFTVGKLWISRSYEPSCHAT
jgi:hypothetical protein